jgi:hypothetical protein
MLQRADRPHGCATGPRCTAERRSPSRQSLRSRPTVLITRAMCSDQKSAVRTKFPIEPLRTASLSSERHAFCFVVDMATKQFPWRRNHFSLAAQNGRHRPWLIRSQRDRLMSTGRAGPRGGQMKILSYIIACALLLAGSTMAGSVDTGLPGIGTFHYSAVPMTTSASRAIALR